MPRAPTVRTSQRQRPAPYETRSASHNMATQLISPYEQQQYSPWEHTPYPQSHMMPMYIPLDQSLQTPHEVPTQPSHPRHQPRNSQSAPWTAQEDNCLLACKRRGKSWEAIHKEFFPNKSGNACRKRYERLENKRRGTDWDEERLEKLAVAYKDMRQEIWEPIARRLGERWEHVEKMCMAEGVKSLTNKASYHARNISLGSSRSHHSGLEHENSSPQDEYDQENQPEDEHEDSGISLGLGSGNRRRSRRMSNQLGVSNTLDPGRLHNILAPAMYRQ